MNAFYEHHKDNIRFNYRCFDRILLNGLIQPFQQPERVIGFCDAYRQQCTRVAAPMPMPGDESGSCHDPGATRTRNTPHQGARPITDCFQ